jgi:hypothetical protein
MWGASMSKMLNCAHEGCKVKVHRFCQIDWLQQHCLEVNHDDPIFLPTAQQVLPELSSISRVLQRAIPEFQNFVRLRARQYHAEGE